MSVKSLAFGLGCSWVAFFVGAAFANVGNIPTEPTESPGGMPIAFFFITGIPFLLGLMAGKGEYPIHTQSSKLTPRLVDVTVQKEKAPRVCDSWGFKTKFPVRGNDMGRKYQNIKVLST